MKPLHWHHDSSGNGKSGGGWSIGIGVLLGIAVLVWILDPLHEKPTGSSSAHGLTFSAELMETNSLDMKQMTEFLVESIIQIESQGDPTKVGGVGERGLMQIREGTWNQVTELHFENPPSFDRAFEPELNRTVGSYYLGDLQKFLYKNREYWQSDLRSLLLACYNAGPDRVRRSNFNLKKLPESVQSYAERGSALHDWYLSDGAKTLAEILKQTSEVPDQE